MNKFEQKIYVTLTPESPLAGQGNLPLIHINPKTCYVKPLTEIYQWIYNEVYIFNIQHQ